MDKIKYTCIVCQYKSFMKHNFLKHLRTNKHYNNTTLYSNSIQMRVDCGTKELLIKNRMDILNAEQNIRKLKRDDIPEIIYNV